jgi:hypothetical protein
MAKSGLVSWYEYRDLARQFCRPGPIDREIANYLGIPDRTISHLHCQLRDLNKDAGTTEAAGIMDGKPEKRPISQSALRPDRSSPSSATRKASRSRLAILPHSCNTSAFRGTAASPSIGSARAPPAGP